MAKSKYDCISMKELKQLIEGCTLATIRTTHELMTGTDTTTDFALKCRMAGIFDVTDRILVATGAADIDEE